MSNQLIRSMFNAAIADASPATIVRDQRQRQPLTGERIVVISVGKAAVAMAHAAVDLLGERISAGIAISKAVDATLIVTITPEPKSHALFNPLLTS